MSKQVFWLVATIFFGTAVGAEAQQNTKIPRIGILLFISPAASSSSIAAFQKGLRDIGYEEGKTIAIEYLYAEGKTERLPDLAAELVRLKVDVIVSAGIQPSQAAKQATKTIPIVFAGVGDPVGWGLIDSLAHPGRNLTGFTNFSPELS